MKAQKAKIKKNEGPEGQNERKGRPTWPKLKEMKAQKAKNWKMEPGPGQLNLFSKNANFTGFFGNLGGGAHELATTKLKGKKGPEGQNERK